MRKKIKAFLQTAPTKIKIKWGRRSYQRWIREKEQDILETEPLVYQPLISVVVPVYNVESRLLTDCVESVRGQTYSNWELCMADDASTMPSVRETLRQYEGAERVKICYRRQNGHISLATNSALEMADGEFVAFLDCDDQLAPNALYEVAKLLNRQRELDFIYSDEDKINKAGTKRHYPHFKADWSPDTLMSMMYTSHLGVYRRSLVEELGGLRAGYEGAQDYDLTLRVAERTDRIGHVPRVLYHWRECEGSTSADMGAKPYVLEAQRRAKEDALIRRGLAGNVEFLEEVAQFRVNYLPPEETTVSILLVSQGNFKQTGRCEELLRGRSRYKNYELLAADRDTCQEQAERARGELLLFLQDDMELVTEDGIARMAGHACLAHAGCVGAKILYPNGHTIYHCGVADAPEGFRWVLQGMDDRIGYDLGINRVDYNYPVVTGGCLMVAREKYLALRREGISGPELQQDAVLCRRLRERGYHNILRNDVVWYKHGL